MSDACVRAMTGKESERERGGGGREERWKQQRCHELAAGASFIDERATFLPISNVFLIIIFGDLVQAANALVRHMIQFEVRERFAFISTESRYDGISVAYCFCVSTKLAIETTQHTDTCDVCVCSLFSSLCGVVWARIKYVARRVYGSVSFSPLSL